MDRLAIHMKLFHGRRWTQPRIEIQHHRLPAGAWETWGLGAWLGLQQEVTWERGGTRKSEFRARFKLETEAVV